MAHMNYDSTLVVGSACIAVAVCYFAMSVEQLLFKKKKPLLEKWILLVSGLLLGLAVWLMHFMGILACKLPENYTFDFALTVVSYLVAAISAIFAIWMTTRPTLPLGRLMLGAILMGLGISGMHYIGMAGLISPITICTMTLFWSCSRL